jgi:DNA modification methylase
MDAIHLGDCCEVLKGYDDQTFNLVVTSPPYADQRKKTYGGIHPDKYVEWFLPISAQLFRVLKDDGSFVLNIKEKVVNGERHTYVLDLIKAMKGQGWLWTEEYIWRKRNCFPGKWPNRLRDSWERCLHFTKQKSFKMNQEAVKVPMGDWAKSRLKKLSDTDKTRDESKTKSGFGKNISNWLGREFALPTNVLDGLAAHPEDVVDGLTAEQLQVLAGYLMDDNVITLPTECGNQKHSAAFPVALPEWFIKLFSDPADIVLDPFAGSGTTGVACVRQNRSYCLIELLEGNHRVITTRLSSFSANHAPLENNNNESGNGRDNQQGGGGEADCKVAGGLSQEASIQKATDDLNDNSQGDEPGSHAEVAPPRAL